MAEKPWWEKAGEECDNLLSHRGLKAAFAVIIKRHYEESRLPECRTSGSGLHRGPEPCPRCGGKGRIMP